MKKFHVAKPEDMRDEINIKELCKLLGYLEEAKMSERIIDYDPIVARIKPKYATDIPEELYVALRFNKFIDEDVEEIAFECFEKDFPKLYPNSNVKPTEDMM